MAAVSAGPGIVALVGPEGSGKTSILQSYSDRALPGTTELRAPGVARHTDISVDLIDGGDDEISENHIDLDFTGIQVVAMRNERLARFRVAHPEARIVHVCPMDSSDIRVMVNGRRKQHSLKADAFTLKSMATLDKLCAGNPRRLNLLFDIAERAAVADHSPKILGTHVEYAGHCLAGDRAAASAGVIANAVAAPTSRPLRLETFQGCAPAETVVPGAAETRPAFDPTAGAIEPGKATAVPEHLPSWDILNAPQSPQTQRSLRLPVQQAQAGGLVVVLALASAVVGLFMVVPTKSAQNVWRDAGTAAANVTRYVMAVFQEPPAVPRSAMTTAMSAPVAVSDSSLPDAIPQDPLQKAPSAAPPAAADATIPPPRSAVPFVANEPLASPARAVDLAGEAEASRAAQPQATPAIIASADAHKRAASMTDPERSTRSLQLLAYGKAFASIGQRDDAEKMFEASAEMGNTNAEEALATLRQETTPNAGQPVRKNPKASTGPD